MSPVELKTAMHAHQGSAAEKLGSFSDKVSVAPGYLCDSKSM